MSKVFISYRREDTDGYAGRIGDLLSERLGTEKVFIDVETILPGRGYPEVLQSELDSCDVLLAVIGPKWTTATDANGKIRLNETDDWVRREVAAALQRQIPVVPVLVGNAKLPAANELPLDLQPLVHQQVWEVTPQGFRDRVKILGTQLEKIMRDETEKRASIERERRIAQSKAEAEEYKSTVFPLRPYSYPLWVLFFCSAVVLAAFISLTLVPTYFSAAENIVEADAALTRGQISNAIHLYEVALNSFPDSNRAKIGLAYSLFKQGTDPNRAFSYLKGVDLDQPDWDRLAGVMPAEYKKRFSIRVGKYLFKGVLVHGSIPTLNKGFLVAVAPLFVNTLLCAILTFPAFFPFFIAEISSSLWPIFLGWLGLSLGMHAFPEKKVIEAFIDSVSQKPSGGATYLLYRAFAWLMALVNLLRHVWIDLIYAVAVASAMPLLLLRLLA
jgi:TIR domain